MIDIKVPTVGESISEVTLVKWLKKDGDYVQRDELLCELESEKATFELNAEQAGVLKIIAQEGATLNIGDVACSIDETAAKPAGSDAASEKAPEKEVKKQENGKAGKPKEEKAAKAAEGPEVKATPVAKSIMADKQVKPTEIKGSGSLGKILKNDVLEALQHPGRKGGDEAFSRNQRRDKMSNLRKTVSRRLVEAKNTTAMLTTFNEVDMGRIMEIRTKYKETFKETHGVNLGFMSFFTNGYGQDHGDQD
jgi:2-oxoglutarate dehydrogenase E2 component (dihydrolipoamide succinyltransferase)